MLCFYQDYHFKSVKLLFIHDHFAKQVQKQVCLNLYFCFVLFLKNGDKEEFWIFKIKIKITTLTKIQTAVSVVSCLQAKVQVTQCILVQDDKQY